MLTSLYFSLAQSHGEPGQRVGEAFATAFREARRQVALMDIDTFVLGRAAVVIGQFRTLERKLLNISHKLYRYEDVIFDKRAWADDMLCYLGFSVSVDVIERAVAENDAQPEIEDPTQHIRRVVPGDHAEKLRAGTIAELNQRFEPILRRYQYA